MENRIFHNLLTILPENRIYLERPRINQLLNDALRLPVVIVSAGTGYGKTRAVYSFLRKYDAVTTWIQLSKRDNLAPRFWENFTRTIALYNKSFSERLINVGFPETDDQFEQYLAIPEDEISPNEKNVIVFDDFHLIENKSVLHFIRRSVQSQIPNITTILISRTEPDISTVSMISKGLVVSIQEADLRFTE
jgi:LuxR family maltose regulon positive regulatory protein